MPRLSRAFHPVRALCFLLVVAACSEESARDAESDGSAATSVTLAPAGGSPRTVSLARTFLSSGAALEKGSGVHAAGATGAGEREVRLEADGVDAWASIAIERSDWLRVEDGLWRAPVMLQGRGKPGGGSPPQRLESSERAFDSSPIGKLIERGPGSFALDVHSVLLRLNLGEEPPAQSKLSVFCERATPSARGWLVRGRRYSGQGVALWPGESVAARVEIPVDSVLRFATVAEPILVDAEVDAKTAPAPVHFRILAGGEELFAHTMDATQSAADWHVADLGELAGARELRLEVTGALAHGGFLAPTIGPRDPEARADGRPSRPDIILFVADTLRADVMSAYGGTTEIAPFLDQLARKSLVFTQARSTSTYTLPSHSSMFTGLFPHQVRVKGTGYALPDEVHTIAELLGAAGYRTGAVTDSVQVSRKYGLDQGFDWFDEQAESLETTLARAADFLDADDGRPTFLFVHTYRAHLPYAVTAETLAEHGERLGIRGDFEVLRTRLNEAQQRVIDRQKPMEASQNVKHLARRLRSHYSGGVIDLDRGIERFWKDLEQRGMLDDSYVLFTSDHGEAFYEHGVIYHTGKVWDELVRVPMMLMGPDIQPGVQDKLASLVDLAPTFAALAGIPAHPDWEGTSLLDLPDERPVFSFECYYHQRADATLSVVQGSRKVIGYEQPGKIAERGILAAFDLSQDPGERNDVSGLEDWPAELLSEMAPIFETLLQPAVEESEATIDAAMLEELRAMGYVTD